MQNAFLFSATAVLLSVGAATAQTTTVVTPGQPVVVTQPQVTHVETTDPATTGGGAMGGATTGAVAGGALVHRAGISAVPGLAFLGLPWQRTRGSALLGFVGADAAWLARRLTAAAA